MTNNFLLNLLGFNPDLTSRQPRVDSLPLVSRQSDLLTHLGRITAILVLVLTIGVGNVWGANQTYTLVSDLSTLTSTDKVLIVSSNGSSSYYALKNGQQATASNLPETSVTITSNTITADLDADYTWYLEYKDNETIGGSSYRRYYIKSTAGTYYLQNTGATKSLITSKSETDLENVWVIGYQGSASIKVSGVTNTYYCTGLYNRSNSRMLAHQSSDWRCQTSTNWNNLSNRVVQIYKQESSCSNAVTLSKGSESHGTVTTIGSTSVATCSGTASERRVTITITPDECYDAPSTLTWTKSSGTVSASKQSGPTDNGNGTYSYVYQFAQDDKGSGTFGVTCTAKAAGKTVNFDAGPGVSASSSLTETCDGSGVTLPAVTASGVCKGWTTFAGWRTSAVSDSSTTNPGTLYAAGSKYTPSSDNETLYAVYSKVKAGGSASWTLCTSAPSTGDSVMLAYYTGSAYKYMKNSGANNDDLTVVAGVATPVSDGKFKLVAGNSYGVSLQNNSYYLHLNSSAINVTTARTNGDINISSGSSSNSFIIKRHSGSTTYDRVLTWSGTNWATSDNMSNGCEVYFFKKTTSTTYYCSDPNCCTNLGTINGSIKWSKELEDIESPNSFNIYLVYFSMSKIFLSLISVPDSSTIFSLYFVFYIIPYLFRTRICTQRFFVL